VSDVAAFSSLYLAFALFRARSIARLPANTPTWISRHAGGFACLALLVGLAEWKSQHDLTTALLLTLITLSTVATAVTLLTPLWPRFSWLLALVCLPFALLGGAWSALGG
jgi:hypothetical protein